VVILQTFILQQSSVNAVEIAVAETSNPLYCACNFSYQPQFKTIIRTIRLENDINRTLEHLNISEIMILQWLVEYNAALACVCFMTLLGFVDDVLDVPWRV